MPIKLAHVAPGGYDVGRDPTCTRRRQMAVKGGRQVERMRDVTPFSYYSAADWSPTQLNFGAIVITSISF